jgi:hypothetical protein
MTSGEIKFAIVSRNFFHLSRKYEANALAATAGLLYDIPDDATHLQNSVAGFAAAGHRPGAD